MRIAHTHVRGLHSLSSSSYPLPSPVLSPPFHSRSSSIANCALEVGRLHPHTHLQPHTHPDRTLTPTYNHTPSTLSPTYSPSPSTLSPTYSHTPSTLRSTPPVSSSHTAPPPPVPLLRLVWAVSPCPPQPGPSPSSVCLYLSAARSCCRRSKTTPGSQACTCM